MLLHFLNQTGRPHDLQGNQHPSHFLQRGDRLRQIIATSALFRNKSLHMLSSTLQADDDLILNPFQSTNSVRFSHNAFRPGLQKSVPSGEAEARHRALQFGGQFRERFHRLHRPLRTLGVPQSDLLDRVHRLVDLRRFSGLELSRISDLAG